MLPTADQGKFHIPSIVKIGGYIEKILGEPPKSHTRPEVIPFSQKISCHQQGHEQLQEGSTKGMQKSSEGAENYMASFVKNQIDIVKNRNRRTVRMF